jgi:hypothetical protein
VDDVALPGFDELTARRRSKTETGYITHLSQLTYADGWRFWALAHLAGDLRQHTGGYEAGEVEAVFLTRHVDGIRDTCRALVVIDTGEILHAESYPDREV